MGNAKMSGIDQMSLRELRALREEIDARFYVLRLDAVASIFAAMSQYGITPKDIAGALKQRSPMYRDPISGRTWTGRGPAPRWLRDVPEHKRERFRIGLQEVHDED